MNFNFDLISDLHVESWKDFDWADQATSPYCIVAGDVARDPEIVAETLDQLGKCYAGVFYIDGNEEHRHRIDNLESSYVDLQQAIKQSRNVVYLQNNVVIINGVAILSTNGWWTYEFDSVDDIDQSVEWYANYVGVHRDHALGLRTRAMSDAAYLMNGVKKLQTHNDVKRIVVVTHTLPCPEFVAHDPDIVGHWRYNSMGNNFMNLVLDEDTENKISHWVFGHYHKSIDQIKDRVHYISNPRGRGNTPWCQTVYYPKRITVEI